MVNRHTPSKTNELYDTFITCRVITWSNTAAKSRLWWIKNNLNMNNYEETKKLKANQFELSLNKRPSTCA